MAREVRVKDIRDARGEYVPWSAKYFVLQARTTALEGIEDCAARLTDPNLDHRDFAETWNELLRRLGVYKRLFGRHKRAFQEREKG